MNKIRNHDYNLIDAFDSIDEFKKPLGLPNNI